MRIAIVGSREFTNQQAVIDYVNTLSPDTIVVSGGARGVDTWAEQAARRRGLEVEIHLPDWNTYGKSAGARRNAQMVSAADRIVAFWDGKSRGTKITIDMAENAGKPATIIRG